MVRSGAVAGSRRAWVYLVLKPALRPAAWAPGRRESMDDRRRACSLPGLHGSEPGREAVGSGPAFPHLVVGSCSEREGTLGGSAWKVETALQIKEGRAERGSTVGGVTFRGFPFCPRRTKSHRGCGNWTRLFCAPPSTPGVDHPETGVGACRGLAMSSRGQPRASFVFGLKPPQVRSVAQKFCLQSRARTLCLPAQT